MNYIKQILCILPFAFLFIACSGFQNSDEYKTLKAENDSLKLSKDQFEQEINEYLSAINSIQENIETIKDTEGSLYIKPIDEFSNKDALTRLNEDMAFLNELLKKNKSELNLLNKKLNKSSLKIKELEKTISRLTAQLEEESRKVTELAAELKQKNVKIEELTQTIIERDDNIAQLETKKAETEATLKIKEDALHTAWYVFGTRKELKEQNILTSTGAFRSKNVLEADFNKDYFIKIDTRNIHSIPFYSSRAKILTTHPSSSYNLTKENDNFVLVILNAEAFWSISKYLVIEVD